MAFDQVLCQILRWVNSVVASDYCPELTKMGIWKMSEVLDIIDRPIQVDDFVAFYSNVYKVLGLGKPNARGHAQVRIKLAEPSKSTKSVVKYSRDMCVIPAEEVTLWLLKKGYS